MYLCRVWGFDELRVLVEWRGYRGTSLIRNSGNGPVLGASETLVTLLPW